MQTKVVYFLSLSEIFAMCILFKYHKKKTFNHQFDKNIYGLKLLILIRILIKGRNLITYINHIVMNFVNEHMDYVLGFILTFKCIFVMILSQKHL
jgi:hypothetical protein